MIVQHFTPQHVTVQHFTVPAFFCIHASLVTDNRRSIGSSGVKREEVDWVFWGKEGGDVLGLARARANSRFTYRMLLKREMEFFVAGSLLSLHNDISVTKITVQSFTVQHFTVQHLL